MIAFLMSVAGVGNGGRKDQMPGAGGMTAWEGLRELPEPAA